MKSMRKSQDAIYLNVLNVPSLSVIFAIRKFQDPNISKVRANAIMNQILGLISEGISKFNNGLELAEEVS